MEVNSQGGGLREDKEALKVSKVTRHLATRPMAFVFHNMRPLSYYKTSHPGQEFLSVFSLGIFPAPRKSLVQSSCSKISVE